MAGDGRRQSHAPDDYPHTFVVPLQNGVEAAAQLAESIRRAGMFWAVSVERSVVLLVRGTFSVLVKPIS